MIVAATYATTLELSLVMSPDVAYFSSVNCVAPLSFAKIIAAVIGPAPQILIL